MILIYKKAGRNLKIDVKNKVREEAQHGVGTARPPPSASGAALRGEIPYSGLRLTHRDSKAGDDGHR